MMQWYVTDNRSGAIPLTDVPVVNYRELYDDLADRLVDTRYHIGNYFASAGNGSLRLFLLLLDDKEGTVMISSYVYGYYTDDRLPSLTALHVQVHPFERALTERYGIRFEGNPWPKPLRFPHDRYDKRSSINNYPFYTISGESLHEVNVGPIHAGIIEPGAFRFICNGEKVLHLEIALGYQHRGIESLMVEGKDPLQRIILAENIAGDSAVGHASAHANVIEKLIPDAVEQVRSQDIERTIALEMERIAMHIADTGALCMDIGYQAGQVACEALRTLVINTMQSWCGNRFGKGLVRLNGTNYPLTPEIKTLIADNTAEVIRRYRTVREDLKSTQSLLARFEDCGVVELQQMARIGGVGPCARASGLPRDIRSTHPCGIYGRIAGHDAQVKQQGDVMARLMIRGTEIYSSFDHITALLALHGGDTARPRYDMPLRPSSIAFGLIEGWRGEICHAAVTGADGLAAYSIKDPSMHNWLALALAVRGEGISDFPICNKSFNLSYCGHDL